MIRLSDGVKACPELATQFTGGGQQFTHLELLGGNHQADTVGDMLGGVFHLEVKIAMIFKCQINVLIMSSVFINQSNLLNILIYYARRYILFGKV
jgi:hypothetical protein